jgi:hypothetical protein
MRGEALPAAAVGDEEAEVEGVLGGGVDVLVEPHGVSALG